MRSLRTVGAICVVGAVVLLLGACTNEDEVSLTSASKAKPATVMTDARDKVQRRSVDELEVGDTAYGEPSSIWFDAERHGWLLAGSSLHPQPVGGFRMKVERRPDGYHVWLPSGLQFAVSRKVGKASSNYTAVAMLHTEQGESRELPTELVASTIARLKVGQSTYAFPLTMSFDKNRRGWLNASRRMGAASDRNSMRIERRADGYHVWLVEGETYFAEGSPGSSYLPVVALHMPDGATVDRLPTALLTRTVREMKVGETGYIESWSLGSDKEGAYWLEAGFEVRSKSGDRFTIRVERHADGYHVWLPTRGSSVKTGRINHDMVRASSLVRVVKVHAAA